VDAEAERDGPGAQENEVVGNIRLVPLGLDLSEIAGARDAAAGVAPAIRFDNIVEWRYGYLLGYKKAHFLTIGHPERYLLLVAGGMDLLPVNARLLADACVPTGLEVTLEPEVPVDELAVPAAVAALRQAVGRLGLDVVRLKGTAAEVHAVEAGLRRRQR